MWTIVQDLSDQTFKTQYSSNNVYSLTVVTGQSVWMFIFPDRDNLGNVPKTITKYVFT